MSSGKGREERCIERGGDADLVGKDERGGHRQGREGRSIERGRRERGEGTNKG